KQKVEPLTLPSVEELTNTRVEKFTTRIDDVLATTELSELTSVIEQYELSRAVPATTRAAPLPPPVLERTTRKAEPLPRPPRPPPRSGPGWRPRRRPSGARAPPR